MPASENHTCKISPTPSAPHPYISQKAPPPFPSNHPQPSRSSLPNSKEIHPPTHPSTHHFSFSSSLRSQATSLSVTWFWRLYSTKAFAALTDSSPVLTRAVPICGFWFCGWEKGKVRGEWEQIVGYADHPHQTATEKQRTTTRRSPALLFPLPHHFNTPTQIHDGWTIKELHAPARAR